MSVYIAPGIYSEEIDQSLYIPMVSTSILGLVGGFKKGPVDEVTLITSRNEFEQIFGTPLRGDIGMAAHAAFYFLRFGNQLKVVRVGDGTEAKSSANVMELDTVGSQLGVVRGLYEGDWADGIQVKVTSDDIPSEGGGTETIYIVRVYAVGDVVGTDQPLEEFVDVDFSDSSLDNYVEKVVNEYSLYIEFAMTALGIPDATGTWTLASGADGTTSLDTADINTGIDLFADPTGVDVNLLSAPGFNHDEVTAAKLITVAAARADCLAILDTPDLTTAAVMVDYVRGDSPYSTVLASSSRAAIYGPWIQIEDSYNNEKIWVSPSVRVLGMFAFSDRVAFPWYAAAGPNRGILYDTLDVRFKMTVGDIEATYGNQNNINPIRSTVDGILVDGNKTTLRKPGLLQNVNIARMLMYAEKAIATGVRYMQWEPHDERTWRQYTSIVTPYIDNIAANRGITSFRIKCDKDTNTAYYINNNQLVAELHIIPTTTVAKIVNRYIIHPHGVTLE